LLICMEMSGYYKNDWTKPKKFKGPPPEAAGLLHDEPCRLAEYTPTRPNLEIPKLPEPYKTEKDTFKY
ncbi:MAG: hypothetical protein HGA22_07505, partial [Clostridiales bacterium]|nr:hypothetical protein [Clostridiales bacterium]